MSSDARAARRRQSRKQDAGWTANAWPSPIERWALPLVVAATLAALIAAILLTRGGGSAAIGGGPAPGARAPAFSALDVVSGRRIGLADLRGRKTLLFFSEGASCQACLVQIADLQRDSNLRKEGIRLVSVSTDSPGALSAAARQYGITTPLLSDASRKMSSDYGMLGKGGMGHPDVDGHAFALLDARGRIAWERAYGQMYVPPDDLLAQLPEGS